jgi:hypothetical protein
MHRRARQYNARMASVPSIPDWGPLYRETDLSRLPVEPWATCSNVVFLAIAVYWAYRIRHQLREQVFIAWCLPVLLVGFVGGTVFHATRSHPVWLLMDFMPIMILCVAGAVHYWRRTGAHWLVVIAGVVGPIALVQSLNFALDLPHDMHINLGYASLSVPIVLPIAWHAIRSRQRAGWLVAGALASFGVALAMRGLDLRASLPLLPMGTHWLWHTFGGISTHLLIAYIHSDHAGRAGAGAAR